MTNNNDNKGKRKLYMMTASEEEACGYVVTGTFSINSNPVKVLFDSGASFSFLVHTTIRTLELVKSESIPVPAVIPSAITSGKNLICHLVTDPIFTKPH